MIKKEWMWMNQLNQNKMSYKLQERAERYVDIIGNGYNIGEEFEWLVKAVLSDPAQARENLIQAIKELTNDNADSEDDACDMLYGVDNNQ
jgi:hypothetical protein